MSHVYLHIPFCRRRCSYCDFAIAVRRRVPADQYLDALRRELAWWRAAGALAGPSATVYLGGGTPSLLPPAAVRAVLRDALSTTPAPDAVEVTLEANPEDVTSERALAWREAGVTRVSLGAQSFDDGVLRWMHRPHDAARTVAAVRDLRRAGFSNLSLDLIFAVPAELERDWSRDLDAALALDPAHVSLYGLTVEERTPLARWIARGATRPTDDARYADEYLLAHERLGAAGFEVYEVSNAARRGMRSRHNAAYWSGAPYVGAGPSAHSFDGATRRWNLAAWEAYRRALAEGRSPVAAEETLSHEQRELERLYLGLRTVEGVSLTAERTAPRSPLPALQRQGWVVVADGRLRCTPEGWLRLDALVRNLTAPSPGA